MFNETGIWQMSGDHRRYQLPKCFRMPSRSVPAEQANISRGHNDPSKDTDCSPSQQPSLMVLPPMLVAIERLRL